MFGAKTLYGRWTMVDLILGRFCILLGVSLLVPIATAELSRFIVMVNVISTIYPPQVINILRTKRGSRLNAGPF